jgi:N utilization substance protein B
MLSRRHLRIKALQALYAYFITENLEIIIGEKNMLRSTEKIYGLVAYQLSFLVEIVKFATNRSEEAKKKFYPTEDELNPNEKFLHNRFIQQLSQNRDFMRKVNAYKINWIDEQDMVRKIFLEIKESGLYEKFMSSDKDSYAEDKIFITKIFKHFIAQSESLESFYEELDIYWADDLDVANILVLKIINGFDETWHELQPLPELYSTEGKDDPEEDKKFLLQLYRKTIVKSKEFEKMIDEKASNWELERIALMDIILIKMALAEFIEFPSIPVKVTMNEYIELSKYYSTPKSRVFINGILDNMITDLKKENKLLKIGRGLIE